MNLKALFAALALSVSPVIASAHCSSMTQSASTCEEGQIWDADSGTCIAPVSS